MRVLNAVSQQRRPQHLLLHRLRAAPNAPPQAFVLLLVPVPAAAPALDGLLSPGRGRGSLARCPLRALPGFGFIRGFLCGGVGGPEKVFCRGCRPRRGGGRGRGRGERGPQKRVGRCGGDEVSHVLLQPSQPGAAARRRAPECGHQAAVAPAVPITLPLPLCLALGPADRPRQLLRLLAVLGLRAAGLLAVGGGSEREFFLRGALLRLPDRRGSCPFTCKNSQRMSRQAKPTNRGSESRTGGRDRGRGSRRGSARRDRDLNEKAMKR